MQILFEQDVFLVSQKRRNVVAKPLELIGCGFQNRVIILALIVALGAIFAVGLFRFGGFHLFRTLRRIASVSSTP